MLIESFFLSEVFCYRLVTSAFLSLFYICFLFSGCPAYGLWGVFGLQFQNLFTGQFSSGQPSGEHPSTVTFLKVGFSPSLSFYPNNLAVFQLHLFIRQTLLSTWLSSHKMAARRARVTNRHKAWKLQKTIHKISRNLAALGDLLQLQTPFCYSPTCVCGAETGFLFLIFKANDLPLWLSL